MELTQKEQERVEYIDRAVIATQGLCDAYMRYLLRPAAPDEQADCERDLLAAWTVWKLSGGEVQAAVLFDVTGAAEAHTAPAVSGDF